MRGKGKTKARRKAKAKAEAKARKRRKAEARGQAKRMRKPGETIRTTEKNRVHRYLIPIMFIAFVVGISVLVFNPSFLSPNQPNYDYIGKIVNIQFVGRTEGTVLEDRDCFATGPNLTTCTAIIYADSDQELHFKYTHDMHAKRCLSIDDRVIVEGSNLDEATVTLAE